MRSSLDLFRTLLARRTAGPAAVARWYASGRPAPPPGALKRFVLRRQARRFRLTSFVETGTFMGDTAEALARHLPTVITIELSPELAESARRRLASLPNVSVLQGDSGDVLPQVVASLPKPALFWLDGHHSGGMTARGDLETPIRAELSAILRPDGGEHVVLIDDARCFVGGDYPTLPELEAWVREHAPGYRVRVRNDIIRLLPPRRRPWLRAVRPESSRTPDA